MYIPHWLSPIAYVHQPIRPLCRWPKTSMIGSADALPLAPQALCRDHVRPLCNSNLYRQGKRKNRELEIPNNSRILDFTLYSPNLKCWVGFVTGRTFTTHFWNVQPSCLLYYFCEKISLPSGLLLFRERTLFRTCHFLCFRPNPYTIMCESTIRSF